MKISVSNFKSIQELTDFEILPLNILAGVNSSGKSSLTQVILLLKQTLESDVSTGLLLSGKFINIPSLSDFVYDKNNKNTIEISLSIRNTEIYNLSDIQQLFPWLDEISDIKVSLKYQISDIVKCSSISLTIKTSGLLENISLDMILRGENKGKFNLKASNRFLLGQDDRHKKLYKSVSPSFQGLLPVFIETEDPGMPVLNLAIMKLIRECLRNIFSHIVYIGPSRVSPMPIVSYNSSDFRDVGADGQYTRFIMYSRRDEKLDNGLTLIEGVNEWICKKMGLAEDISVERDGTNSYRIRMTDNRGVKVELYQVGFGISQILPIIVQGLLTPEGGILIVDAPEVHIHPSIQGMLMDFFIYMANTGRTVVMETHSDHIVVRIRRRLAEKVIEPEKVNICYVTSAGNGSEFKSMQVDRLGNISSLPEGFLDAMDEDFKSIMKAKMRKNE